MPQTLVDAEWTFVCSGLARGEKNIVDGIRAGQEIARYIRLA
jgi:hypothetical protein